MLFGSGSNLNLCAAFEFAHSDKNTAFKPYSGGNNMSIKTLFCAALSLFLLCGCSSSDKDEDTMISLADYNSHYSEVLNSSEN